LGLTMVYTMCAILSSCVWLRYMKGYGLYWKPYAGHVQVLWEKVGRELARVRIKYEMEKISEV